MSSLNSKKLLMGMVHLEALPGTPKYKEPKMAHKKQVDY